MTVAEFRALLASIQSEHDHRTVLLPEGLHSSTGIGWRLDDPYGDDDDRCVLITVQRRNGRDA